MKIILISVGYVFGLLTCYIIRKFNKRRKGQDDVYGWD